MTDNKNTNKAGVTFYDSELPTAYYIFSKYITNSKEYSKTVDACKEFFDVSMNLIYLADMKDICDAEYKAPPFVLSLYQQTFLFHHIWCNRLFWTLPCPFIIGIAVSSTGHYLSPVS